MSNIPIEKQFLAVNPVDQIQYKVAHGEAVAGGELLEAIEQAQGRPLDDRLRDIVRRCSLPAVKRRGRPSNCKGREDFALKEVDERYPALLKQFEEEAEQRRLSAAADGAILPKAAQTPSELAYTQILSNMKADFPNLDWRALRNKHSEWNNGCFHPVENDVDSEDFEAEIERLFPGPTE